MVAIYRTPNPRRLSVINRIAVAEPVGSRPHSMCGLPVRLLLAEIRRYGRLSCWTKYGDPTGWRW